MHDASCAALTARFNRLSFAGRNALRAASLTHTLSRLVREGTEKRPWLYPFYMAYMVCLISPLPFPGVSTVLLLATAGYAAIPALPGSKALRGHFNEAVKPAAIMARYAEHIHADKAPNAKESLAVRGWGVTCAVAQQGWRDIRQATRYAVNALR